MEYSFVINAANDVSDNYVNTAIETCKEFLELFPEYKDKFDIKIRYSGKEVSAVSGKSIDFDGTISKEKFEQFYPNGNDEFIALPNDRYLVPGESMAWYEAYAKRQDGNLNFSKASPKQCEWTNRYLRSQNPTRYFHIGITNKKLYNNDGLFGYGISSPEIGTFVSTSGFDKETFKRLIMHEFGHVFRAVHTERNNITNTQYGEHCATEGCIARDVVYQSLGEANKPKLFCDQCIEAMRTYIGKIVENERTTEGHTNVVDSSQKLPPNSEPNDEFKKPWRDFAQNLAQKMSWEYEEDEKETNFKAKLKASDGACTYINASSKNDVSLSAKDKDGKLTVPDMQTFNELVSKIQKDGGLVNFGDIKTPEFKARLLIACMSTNPPIETTNAPELSDEFLASIDKTSAQKLKILKKKAESQNLQNNEDSKKETSIDESNKEAPKKTEDEKTLYEESRDERKRLLETKLKINAITAMEQTELNYIKQEEKRKQAKEEAIARTGNNIDPRTAEHTQQSGLSPVSYAYHSSSEREWKGWKLHLDVVPNRDNETTRAVSEFLEQLEVDHKIAKGGENGKGMTIYVGGYEDAFKLSKEIKQLFGKNIVEPPIYTDQKGEETDFNNIVTGRFYLQDIFQTQYPRSSVKGICPADYGSLCDRRMESLVVALAGKEELTDKNYALQNIENTNFHDHYTVTNLESYCAHRFYQKHLGEYYCGRDAEGFERRIFGDVIPPKGSDERRKWDKIAKSYATVLEQENPKCLESIQELKRKYKPIDFRKAPQMTQYHRRGNGGINS